MQIKYKKILIIFICFITWTNQTNSIENRILFKIDDKIITSVDILNEIEYLSLINKNLKKFEKNKIFEISKNSIIKEKIKIIEILKYKKKIEIDKKYLTKLIRESYLKINLKTELEFLEHLAIYNLDLEEFKKKITVEALWNQLIFSKFKSRININKDKIRNQIIKDKTNKVISFNLSEIIFDIEKNQILNERFEQIKSDINLNGFENAAMIHSISETSNLGGKIGWINQNSINQKLNNKIISLGIGEFTNPIVVPGGFLIIKLNELKKIDKKINLEEEIKKQMSLKTNQQLNQFSNIYYNKIKKDIKIEKL